jgi:hypothetical protein
VFAILIGFREIEWRIANAGDRTNLRIAASMLAEPAGGPLG